MRKTRHSFDFANTRILTKEHNLQKRLILESININLNNRHSLNLKSDLDVLNPTHTQLLQNLKKKQQ